MLPNNSILHFKGIILTILIGILKLDIDNTKNWYLIQIFFSVLRDTLLIQPGFHMTFYQGLVQVEILSKSRKLLHRHSGNVKYYKAI